MKDKEMNAMIQRLETLHNRITARMQLVDTGVLSEKEHERIMADIERMSEEYKALYDKYQRVFNAMYHICLN